MSSYGATLSKVDLEKYDLIHEWNDQLNSSEFFEVDYQWECATIIRKAGEHDKDMVCVKKHRNDFRGLLLILFRYLHLSQDY